MKLTPRLKEHCDLVYFALPAFSISDIASKSGLKEWEVVEALSFARKNPRLTGWSIPHVKRGRAGSEPRFHCALFDKNNQFETDAGAENSVKDGHLSSLRGWATQFETQAVALRAFAANHADDPYVKRLFRSLSGEAAHMASQTRELIELVIAA